jgi:hypothetical protein
MYRLSKKEKKRRRKKKKKKENERKNTLRMNRPYSLISPFPSSFIYLSRTREYPSPELSGGG